MKYFDADAQTLKVAFNTPAVEVTYAWDGRPMDSMTQSAVDAATDALKHDVARLTAEIEKLQATLRDAPDVAAAVAAERERCARLVEGWLEGNPVIAAQIMSGE